MIITKGFGWGVFGAITRGLGRLLGFVVGRKVALKGDGSSHGGSIISSGQDGSLKVGGIEVAVEDAQHSCPIDGHGITSITAVTIKSYQNGKLILTENAVAGCGAKITPPNRGVFVE